MSPEPGTISRRISHRGQFFPQLPGKPSPNPLCKVVGVTGLFPVVGVLESDAVIDFGDAQELSFGSRASSRRLSSDSFQGKNASKRSPTSRRSWRTSSASSVGSVAGSVSTSVPCVKSTFVPRTEPSIQRAVDPRKRVGRRFTDDRAGRWLALRGLPPDPRPSGPPRQGLSPGRGLHPGLHRHALRLPQPGRHCPMGLRLQPSRPPSSDSSAGPRMGLPIAPLAPASFTPSSPRCRPRCSRPP